MFFVSFNAKTNVVRWIVWFLHTDEEMVGVRWSFAQVAIWLTCTISLPACKNRTILHTTFVLALNDAENISLSEYIVIVWVLFTCITEDIDNWLTGFCRQTLTIQAVSHMPFNVESLFYALSTCSEPLFKNISYICPSSDDTMSRYVLRLKICRATSVHLLDGNKQIVFVMKYTVY